MIWINKLNFCLILNEMLCYNSMLSRFKCCHEAITSILSGSLLTAHPSGYQNRAYTPDEQEVQEVLTPAPELKPQIVRVDELLDYVEKHQANCPAEYKQEYLVSSSFIWWIRDMVIGVFNRI